MEQLILMATQWLGGFAYKAGMKKSGSVKLGKWTPLVTVAIAFIAKLVGVEIDTATAFTQSAVVVGLHSTAKNIIQSAK